MSAASVLVSPLLSKAAKPKPSHRSNKAKQVLSPFQAILDYELSHDIPPGYINHTISATSPNGSWQRIERGEIPLDDTFFALFGAELSRPERWRNYWEKILNDPSKTRLLPKKYRRLAAARDVGKSIEVPKMPEINAKEMFWNMMRMARSPDPHMYPALLRLREAQNADGKPRFVVAALSNTIAFPPGIRDEKGELFASGLHKELSVMKPRTNGTGTRFLQQKASRNPEDGHSTLEIGSPEAEGGIGDERQDIRQIFEVFISSAHVGMRKPERRVYELAVQEIQKLGTERAERIEPGDILFLDDIGGNLKAAREVGMRTIKVTLGRVRDAVKELEGQVGISLIEEGAKL
jgi:hypothetical protein